MNRVLTRYGAAILRDAISKQDARARAAGVEIGEAAGANCDWHDNFAYEDARRRHEMESARLSELASELSGAEVIEVSEQSELVAIGTTVDILVGEEERTFTIGGTREELAGRHLISADSPMAKAILGLRRGEVVDARIGPRTVVIEIVEIHPPSYRYNSLIEEHLKSLGITAS